MTTSNISAGTATQYDVTFNEPFNATPRIVVSLQGSSTGIAYANIQPFVYSKNASGFTLGIANNNSSVYSPIVNWIAVL